MRYTEGQKLTFIRSTTNKTQFPDIPYYISKVVTAPYGGKQVGIVVSPADDTTKGRYYTVTEIKALGERGVFVFDLPTDVGDPVEDTAIEHEAAAETVAPGADASLKAYEFAVGGILRWKGGATDYRIASVVNGSIRYEANDDHFGFTTVVYLRRLINSSRCFYTPPSIETEIAAVDAKIIDTRKLLDSVRADLAELTRQRIALIERKHEAKHADQS